jgi:hypothetical protein
MRGHQKQPTVVTTPWILGLLGMQLVRSRPIATGESKSASTPEEAIKYLAEASKNGDLQGYVSCLAEPFRGMRKALVEVLDALNRFA